MHSDVYFELEIKIKIYFDYDPPLSHYRLDLFGSYPMILDTFLI